MGILYACKVFEAELKAKHRWNHNIYEAHRMKFTPNLTLKSKVNWLLQSPISHNAVYIPPSVWYMQYEPNHYLSFFLMQAFLHRIRQTAEEQQCLSPEHVKVNMAAY